MKQRIVRRLEESVVLAPERRAARHGRPAEAEHRAILLEALAEELEHASFKDLLAAMPGVGSDDDFVAQRDLPREARW